MLTRPARDVEPEQVVEAIEQGMRATGYNEFSLLSLSCSDYLALPAVGVEIKNRLKGENISLSLPSQRVDRFDENIAHILGGTRQGSLTFAPEAGTQRLRDIVNKGLTNEELLRGVRTAFEQGWDRVKLYFMIGLPGETDADVLGIAETMRWLQRECAGRGRKRIGFNVTISNFTPKPHTPFQWHSVSTTEFERKQRLLRQEFRTIRGLKANFTDVRISAMEDFVGRGDRQLSTVVQRAWELGAGMDAWWESLDRAYGAWTQAIAEAGLDWKYRQVESGEWNFSGIPGAQAPAGPADLLDLPLPWDHLDTGIDKQWLKADLQRALEAATVPDCSFDGCSHCGVCGPDFGHNIVVPPPEIPQFSGQFVPNQNRAQRLRLWFGKQAEMALISHLDLIRLLDRAVRRASLPIAFTGGFHPGPRIVVASALSLGITSSGEIVDFDLTEPVEEAEFMQRLAAQLPAQLPLYRIETVPLSAPSATQILDQAEYWLMLYSEDSSLIDWQNWIDRIWAASEIWIEQTTKSGKLQPVNLRERLLGLHLLSPEQLSSQQIEGQQAAQAGRVGLRYLGTCRNNGAPLRPEHLVQMLEWAADLEFQLLGIHRQQLLLSSLNFE